MPSYTFSFYQYNDITAVSGTPTSTTSTTGVTGSFQVNSGASLIQITVNDDDLTFHDSYIDTGTGQTLASPVMVNGITYPAGVTVELEFKVTTSGGPQFSYIRINGVNVGIGGNVMPVPGTTYVITGSTDAESIPYSDLACFAGGTLIRTPSGSVPVQHLQAGDLVETLHDGAQPVLWTASRRLSAADLADNPRFRPVVFAPGSIGNDAWLRVSPQHRMMIDGWRVQMLYGLERVLVPAMSLVNGSTIRIETGLARLSYHHLVFGSHQVIFAEGAPSESFLPGEVALNGLNAAARIEFGQIFGAAAGDAGAEAMQSRLPVLRHHQARVLVGADAA